MAIVEPRKGVAMSTLTELHEPEVLEKAAQSVEMSDGATPDLLPSFFSDILLETDTTERRRRRWAAITSVIVQSLLLGTLLIVPLWFTDALPKAQLLTFLVTPPPPPPPPPPASAPAVQVVRHVESDLSDGRLRTPSRIPQKVQMIREEEAPPQISAGGGVVGGVPGGIPGGQLGGVIGGIVSASSNLASVPKLAAPPVVKRMRISQGVTRGMLMTKIEPHYPVIASAAHVQGAVVLTAIISKTGDIENLTVLSGHPLLVPAAIEAVKKWHYRPFLLNGEPVEVETTVTVTFQLSN